MSNDERALLEAVAAHPDDDTPRLVYADWLDEHGRTAAARVFRGECWRRGGNPENLFHFVRSYPDLCQSVVYLPGATPDVVGLIDRGLVFVMAWWSGPSRQAFADVADALRTFDPARELLTVVVDTDGIGEDFQHELFDPLRVGLSGAGEALWVSGGKPFRASRNGAGFRELRACVLQTLAASELR